MWSFPFLAWGTLLLAGPVRLLRAQETLEIRPDSAQVAVGRRISFDVGLRSADGTFLALTDVRIRSDCADMERPNTFVFRTTGPCVLIAEWTSPAGITLADTARVSVLRRYLAHRPPPRPPPPPPPPPPPMDTAAPPPTGADTTGVGPADTTAAVDTSAAVDTAAQATIPEFPWPPPRATTRIAIPNGLITRPRVAGEPRPPEGPVDTLGYVADSIESALDRAGMERGVYAIGDTGFAYVTRAEMIHSRGEPFAPPDRFPNDVTTATGSHGFLDFLLSRFRARPGYFRIIAIVVTSRPILSSARAPTAAEATALVVRGMATLPASMRRRAVHDLRAFALIYEFQRPTAADEVTLRSAPLVDGASHLSAAGLWTPAQLRRR